MEETQIVKKKRRHSPLTKLLISQEYQLQTNKAIQLLFHLNQKHIPAIHHLHSSTLSTLRSGSVENCFMHKLNTSHLPLSRRAPEMLLTIKQLILHIQQFWRALYKYLYTFGECSKTSAPHLTSGNTEH